LRHHLCFDVTEEVVLQSVHACELRLENHNQEVEAMSLQSVHACELRLFLIFHLIKEQIVLLFPRTYYLKRSRNTRWRGETT